ncbi:hypothetical protein [Croceitalea vernalis]|uniref:Uncharacterized protein n=1 Tax=Croceitalea vernalis TaxID=3075599 RepID=A0ABU3BK32_9FLAO|nr:hypothetical protein [Croceitalea sp. P007]MDT0622465.1 hypothetical protein [Croceitalea sp. P007]
MRTLIRTILIFSIAFQSCSIDEETVNQISQENSEESSDDSAEEVETGSDEESSEDGSNCPENIGFLFEEANGLVSIEFEDNEFPDGWVLKNDVSGVSGTGYMQWEGNPSLGNPGTGMITFPIRISNAGTYRFTWSSSYRKGDNGTEHNDTWLRFPDADDFYGKKNDGSIVYPNDSGKQPNPNGSSKDGWFKIYRSGDNNEFKWQARTSDNDAHDIYITFENEGTYLMEVSARSDFHAIDRILMHKDEISNNDAIEQAENFSAKTVCD